MSSHDSTDRALARAAAQFAANTSNHEMTVLLDETVNGKPYRHVRFAEPGTSIWGFDLVTWPGHLSISGDLASFTFRRLHDMFEFFNTGRVNPGYWAEKVTAGAPETAFSADVFAELVRTSVADAEDAYEPEEYADLVAVIESDLLIDLPECDQEARDLLCDFSYSPRDAEGNKGSVFEFSEVWDWEMSGYDHHFLLSAHAIAYGVRAYLAAYPDRLVRS